MCVLGFAFAYSTERLQAFTSYRACETADLIADAIGICTGAFAVAIHIIVTHK